MHVEKAQAKSPPIIQVLSFRPRCCRQFSGLSSDRPLMDLAPLKTRKCCAPCKIDLCQLILCFSFLFLLSLFITNILQAPSRVVSFGQHLSMPWSSTVRKITDNDTNQIDSSVLHLVLLTFLIRSKTGLKMSASWRRNRADKSLRLLNI